MRPLRFCLITTFYPPYNFGGDGIGVQRTARALSRRGFQVTVIHDADAYATLAPGADPSPADEADGVEVVTLRSRAPRLSALLTQQTGRPVVHGRQIQKIVEEREFDVLHFNNVSLVGGPSLLAYGDGIKVYEAHEHWLVCPSHVLWRHDREPCDEQQCLRCVLRHRRPPQLWRYTGLLERHLDEVDVFVAKSEFSRRKHREFGFPRDMEVLPYFLPERPNARTPDQGPSPHDRPYFLFVGRLERIKGLDDIIPVFERYEDADLLIAGAGGHEETLRAIADGNPRVRFLGRVNPDDLDDLYRHAQALIVPSNCYETFGIIVIEAFRQGTPVVARRIGPLPELVERADAGELFESPDEMAAALRRIQRDPEARSQQGANARAAFSQYWTEAAVIPRYLQLLAEAAQRRGRTDIETALAARSVA
jgi:glycosyltransferase involved in cell wall biosynthesis